MGQLVFQATAGGQVALVGPNPSTSFALNLPAINGTLITSGDTGTVTNTMLANSAIIFGSTSQALGSTVSALNGVSIGGTTASTGKFTSITNSGLTANQVVYAGTAGLESGSANMTFDGTKLTLANDASISGLTVGKGGGAVASNAVLGYQSLFNGSNTGSDIVSIGYQSSYSNSSGVQNTSIGSLSSYSNTTGSSNASLGYGALYYNTTGSFNTAIGKLALESNTTASNNTAVGYQAGYSNSTNQNCTFVGYQAGYASTGDYNCLIGRTSGQAITTGAKNTIIGSYSGNNGGLDIRTANNYIVLSDGDGNPRLIVDINGRVLMGETVAQYQEAVGIGFNGSSAQGLYFNDTYASAGNATAIGFKRSSSAVGSITTSLSATAYNTSSDYRLKENIAPMTGALDKVSQLKPVTYTWKADGSNGQGFIAHELQAVVPDCVTGEKDAVDAEGKPVYQGIDTSFLVATLTAAIQELNAKITALENK